jgi:hypothetical protein
MRAQTDGQTDRRTCHSHKGVSPLNKRETTFLSNKDDSIMILIAYTYSYSWRNFETLSSSNILYILLKRVKAATYQITLKTLLSRC